MDERSTFERADFFCFAQIALGTMILFNDNTHTHPHTHFCVFVFSRNCSGEALRHWKFNFPTFTFILSDFLLSVEKIPSDLVQHSFPHNFIFSLRPLLWSEEFVLSATRFHCSRYQPFNSSPPLSTNIIFNPQCPPVFMICSKSWSVFISCLQFALCLDFLSQFLLALSCSFATPEIAQLTFAFLCLFTSQPREEFLNSFLVALSLSPLTVSGSPPSNDGDDHIPYSQMMVSFIYFFGAKCKISDLWWHLMLLFFAVMTEPGRHAAGTLWSPFWRKCFWIQIHDAGIFFDIHPL